MSGRPWPAKRTMPRVVMFLESPGHLPAGDLKVHDHALFFEPVHRFFEKTTLPPVAMTEVRQWRDRMVSSPIVGDAILPSVPGNIR